MNLYAILPTRRVAGGVSCAAVQGGLLTTIVMGHRNAAPARSGSATAFSLTTRLADDLSPLAYSRGVAMYAGWHTVSAMEPA